LHEEFIMPLTLASIAVASLTLIPAAVQRATPDEYRQAIQRTAAMVRDQQAQNLARSHGLQVLNITWEDTARFKNSAVGPNISDMTIQVAYEHPRTRQLEVTAMPVIRFPNFSDLTGDVDPRRFTLLVGNHRGAPLRRISLYEFLANPSPYLSNPRSWPSRNRTLLASRDTHVLASAQACFLPVPSQGKATFNPVLFNYQSVAGDPAVLTILATREGTSVTVIDNQRDAFRTGSIWGQRLFHNTDGMRASLTGERASDFAAGGTIGPGQPPRPPVRDTAGMNMVLLVQVPLKQRRPARTMDTAPMMGAAGAGMAERRAGSDVENAVIGHGDIEGPFTEIDNLPIERDERYPIRVTVQFYKATSNGIVSPEDMAAIKRDIDLVYSHAAVVGSLVTGGRTGRPTEYEGMKIQPPGWWREFWIRHEGNTGQGREESMRRLREILGREYERQPVSDLYLGDLLRRR
jgi:hypothetical protein